MLVGHLAAGRFARSATTGVTLFFVLSGFLITTLLLEEHARFGRIELRRFYERRLLRLMPALVLVLAVFGAYSIADRTVSAPIVAPAFYVANFWLASGRSLGVFDHLWSLSMEEQFYLLWPVVLALTLRRSRRAAAVVTIAGVLISLGVGVLLAATHHEGVNWVRVRFGPDTRAHALLLGCLGAALCSSLVRTPLVRRLCVPAVAVCALASMTSDGSWLQHLVWRPLVALAGVVLVLAMLDERSLLTRGASWRPLVALGRISYGLYLWHFPIYSLVPRHVGSLPFAIRSALLVALSLAAATLSYRWIEQPFLRLKERLTPRGAGRPVSALN